MSRITISAKIFSIAIGLVLIMAGVGIVTARMTRVIDNQLRVFGDHYMPALGVISLAATKSADQAYWVRRLFLSDLEIEPDPPGDGARIRAQIDESGAAVSQSIATARKLINEQIVDTVDFGDTVSLARLDTRLDLMQDEITGYNQLLPKVIAAIEGNDRARFFPLSAELDHLRDDLEPKIEAARTEMQSIAEKASDDSRAYQTRTLTLGGILVAFASLLGLTVAGTVTRGLVRPVHRLLHGASVIEGGTFDVDIPVTSGDEIGRLTLAFNRMVGELKNKERIRSTFGKYVDPRIVQGLIDRPDLNRVEGERRVMTISFCDMKGFTSLSEGLTPTSLVNVINRYLTLASAPVREEGGIIDKYIGDAIMAFWGPPFCQADDQARHACLAALDQVEAAGRLNAELPDLLGLTRGLPQISVRVGVATGDAVVGDIGSDVTKSYTVMGDTVNLASRLEGASKIYGTHILVNEHAARMAADAVELREVDAIRVIGKTEPERVFELLGRKGQVARERLAFRDRFAAGLEAYRKLRWDEARAAFAACLAEDAKDGPAAVFLERCEHLKAQPPAAEWDGVWSLTHK